MIARLAGTLSSLAALAVASGGGAQSPSSERIPLVEGLTIVTAVSEPLGDYESIKRVTLTDEQRTQIHYSGRSPRKDGGLLRVAAVRSVRAWDGRDGRRYKITWSESDAEVEPGATAIGASTAVLEDLKAAGAARFTVISESDGFSSLLAGEPPVFEFAGTLHRVEPDPVQLSVLVGANRVSLPTIHARGRLGEADSGREAEFWFLDDPSNPLALRFRFGTTALRVIRIDFPPHDELEQVLAERDTAVVYGIHFEFASAEIRPESQPVLEQAAELMRRHPAWRLRVTGHTDSVGRWASNLELSRRRAEAVVAALDRLGVARTRLGAEGMGASHPLESNATLEGRARNRRVELTRF